MLPLRPYPSYQRFSRPSPTSNPSVSSEGRPDRAGTARAGEVGRSTSERGCSRIEAALAIVAEEIDIVGAERRAFESFLDRLEDCEPATQPAGATGSLADSGVTSTLVGQSATSGGARQVPTAYRETVMAVPHYDSEYDDSLVESMRTEFGDDLASYVVSGTDLPPPVYDRLVAATERVIEDRDTFLSALQRERTSLEHVRDELTEIRRLAGLDDGTENGPDATPSRSDERVRDLESRCESLSVRRQERIHSRSVADISGVAEDSLTTYLYAELEATCPTLLSIAETITELAQCRGRGETSDRPRAPGDAW